MTRGPSVLKAFAASWRFDEAGPGATRVTFRYHYKARPPWLRRMIDPALGALFGRDARLRLNGLKRAAKARAFSEQAARAVPGSS
jgi:ribosome-associated toxin RatA of RatAB toxin-antitoxin module